MPKTTIDMKHEREVLAWLEDWLGDPYERPNQDAAAEAKNLLIDLEVSGYSIVKTDRLSIDKIA